MTDATATLYDVTSFDGRVFPLGDYRRVIRGVVIGVGAAAAACALVTSVTVAATWIVSAALSTKPTHRTAPIGPWTLALAKYDLTLVGTADVSGPARVSTGPANAPDLAFEARWARATASAPSSTMPLVPQRPLERANGQAALQVAAATPPPPPASISEKTVSPQQAHNKSLPLPDLGSRTAVYDISARTVYLPNGDKLEAHSGRGDKLDDPRYVHVRMRGPTPPNVYDLTLRAQPFHGVRAIRLNPVDDDKMFGRAGMLAHTYMLGPNGQSNGCVSFRNYQKFLNAYLRGDVDRLVVVPNLGTSPSRIARALRVHVSQYASNNR